MRTEFPIIHQDTQVEDVLNELVDESFICIGNDEDEFVGIVTRIIRWPWIDAKHPVNILCI